MKVSGYSRQQITRWIAPYSKNGTLRRRQRTVAGFLLKYTPARFNCVPDAAPVTPDRNDRT